MPRPALILHCNLQDMSRNYTFQREGGGNYVRDDDAAIKEPYVYVKHASVQRESKSHIKCLKYRANLSGSPRR